MITYYSVTTRTSEGCIFGGSGIGNRNESPEETGKQAAEQFMNGISAGNSCVDEHLQDQVYTSQIVCL